MLALAFLLLIGVSLVAEGLDQHIPKGYIYFAMAFSVFVEMLNLRDAQEEARSRSTCTSGTCHRRRRRRHPRAPRDGPPVRRPTGLSLQIRVVEDVVETARWAVSFAYAVRNS